MPPKENGISTRRTKKNKAKRKELQVADSDVQLDTSPEPASKSPPRNKELPPTNQNNNKSPSHHPQSQDSVSDLSFTYDDKLPVGSSPVSAGEKITMGSKSIEFSVEFSSPFLH